MTRAAQQTYIQRLGFQDKDRSNQRHGLACEYLFDRLLHERLIDKAQDRATKLFNVYRDTIYRDMKALKESYIKAEERFEELDDKDSTYAKRYKETMEKSKSKFEEKSPYAKKLRDYKGTVSAGSLLDGIADEVPATNHINVPIRCGNYVNGFADVLFDRHLYGRLNEVEVENGDLRFWWTGPSTCKSGSSGDVVLGEIKITPEPAENVIQQIAFYRQFIPGVDRVIILVDYEAPTLKRLAEGSDIEVYRLGDKFEDWITKREQPTVEEF